MLCESVGDSEISEELGKVSDDAPHARITEQGRSL